jgi:hypothetical protein
MDTKSVVFSEKSTQSSSAKSLWCNTQWANLSIQAKKLELPNLPYFDPKTGLLSKDVNRKLWLQIVSPLHLLHTATLPRPAKFRHLTRQALRLTSTLSARSRTAVDGVDGDTLHKYLGPINSETNRIGDGIGEALQPSWSR